MLFTTLGRIVAGLIFAYGLLRFAMGLAVATGALVEPEPGRYLGARTSGEAIDQGIYTMLFAIVLGVVVEISRSVSKRNKAEGG